MERRPQRWVASTGFVFNGCADCYAREMRFMVKLLESSSAGQLSFSHVT
jgi:hypothetical protein